MKYICMICGKTYKDGNMPILQDLSGLVGDGCCRIGSLIEVGDVMQSALQNGDITLGEFVKYLKDENTD